ncbi:MAG: hypothetical protein WCR20_00375 [Verrucomicrobiota bacterium]|nr:hypothetical protein [Verrucomicrobiota bacterium]
MRIYSILAACALLVGGCSKEYEVPSALTVAELPTALEKAFSSAAAERKELVDRSIGALKEGKLPNALMVIESLCAIPDLTPTQRTVATRAVLTLNQELQSAAAKGDKSAADFQKLRQSSK